jgi:uncharacterized protein YuzE
MATLTSTSIRGLLEVAGEARSEVWFSYDSEGDVLYINYRKPSVADDSELTDEDIIVRYVGEDVIGMTVLHASKR